MKISTILGNKSFKKGGIGFKRRDFNPLICGSLILDSHFTLRVAFDPQQIVLESSVTVPDIPKLYWQTIYLGTTSKDTIAQEE